jgi:hypothetical protein
MAFRVAVRASEAWLLADQENMSQFLGVAKKHIPDDPERVLDAKIALVNLARKSRSRAIREEMIPAPGTTARVGPGYTGRIIEFAGSLWQPDKASERSESLRRCLDAVKELSTRTL